MIGVGKMVKGTDSWEGVMKGGVGTVGITGSSLTIWKDMPIEEMVRLRATSRKNSTQITQIMV